MNTRPWISTEDAAEQIGCTDRHVRRLLAAGALRGHRWYTRWLIAPDSLRRFLRRRRGRKPRDGGDR